MRWRGDHLPVRLMGCFFGFGALALGCLNIFGAGESAVSDEPGRLDFGLVAITTGLVAVFGSWLTPTIHDLWFCNPERSKKIARESSETLKEMLFAPRRKK